MDDLIRDIKRFVDYIRANSEDRKIKEYANKVYQNITDFEFKLNFDELTGLFGRKQFEKILEKEAAFTERTGKTFAFIMLDLVGLKHVNDTYSRSVGDEYIRFASKWLSENTRETDIIGVGRFGEGADEFGIIARGDDIDVLKTIKRLKDKLKGIIFQGTIPLMFTMGGAMYDKGGNLKAVIEKAEIILNKDKELRKKEGYKVRS